MIACKYVMIKILLAFIRNGLYRSPWANPMCFPVKSYVNPEKKGKYLYICGLAVV